jgi:hemoglobin
MASEGLIRAQVDAVVRTQYERLRSDAVVGKLFAGIEPGGAHEMKIADFWWASFGGKLEQKRDFDMLGKHRALDLTEQAFTIWFGHLQAAVDTHLTPVQASMWMKRAELIGVNLKRFTIGGEQVSSLMQIGDPA